MDSLCVGTRERLNGLEIATLELTIVSARVILRSASLERTQA